MGLRSGEKSPYISQMKGLITMAASQANEKSMELSKIEHGLFTHCLIEGLEGGADKRPYGDEDGLISVAELTYFLQEEVKDRALKAEHIQNPNIIVEQAGPSKLYLSRTGKK